MTRIYETLAPVGRLQMTLQVMSPTRLAQTVAALVGQFYDRSATLLSIVTKLDSRQEMS